MTSAWNQCVIVTVTIITQLQQQVLNTLISRSQIQHRLQMLTFRMAVT